MTCSPHPDRTVRRTVPAHDHPVFDRTRAGVWTPAGRKRSAAAGAGAPVFTCRNAERDRKPPRSVVTAQLMGDPPANRQR